MISPSVFLSYRREDSSGHTGWLHSSLVGRWGDSRVFWDIDSIKPGDDFVEAIDRTLDECSIVLVVIGPYWTAVTDKTGKRRLDNGADYHRLEIERALVRQLRVIPILVGGAKMPSESELPESLRSLARKNAFELTDKRFAYDVTKLVETVERVLTRGPTEPPAIDATPPPARKETKPPKPATTTRQKGSDKPSVSAVTQSGSRPAVASAHPSSRDTSATEVQIKSGPKQPSVTANPATGRLPRDVPDAAKSPAQTPARANKSTALLAKSRIWRPLALLGIGLAVVVIGSQVWVLGLGPKKADVSPAASPEPAQAQAASSVPVGDPACVQIGDNVVCPKTTVNTGRPATITKKAANGAPANCAEIGGNLICPEKYVRLQVPSPSQKKADTSSAAPVAVDPRSSVQEGGSPCVQIGDNLVCPKTAADTDRAANATKKAAKRVPIDCVEIGGNIVCPKR